MNTVKPVVFLNGTEIKSEGVLKSAQCNCSCKVLLGYFCFVVSALVSYQLQKDH